MITIIIYYLTKWCFYDYLQVVIVMITEIMFNKFMGRVFLQLATYGDDGDDT